MKFFLELSFCLPFHDYNILVRWPGEEGGIATRRKPFLTRNSFHPRRSREPEARQRKRERDLVRFETRRRNLFADRVCRPVCSSPLEFLRGSFIEMPRLLPRLPCSRKLVNGQSRIMSGIGGDESFTRNVCKG